jgi:DNA-binding transcriptional ArsR family regulator
MAGARTPVDEALAALADPTRRAVVELLGERPHRAGELAEALAMSAPALSRHLRVLKQAGLVADDEPAEDARVRLYRLERSGFDPLDVWMASVHQLWAEQLGAFAAHVARRRR